MKEETSVSGSLTLAIGPVIVLVLLLLLVWSVSRRIRRHFQRSLKARQDQARGVSDLSDRLDRIETKLEEKAEPER